MLSPAEIRWIYQYYLARSPEDGLRIGEHSSPRALAQELYKSTEAQGHESKKNALGEFCLWREGRIKIVVMSNCQAPEIARALASIADVSAYGFEVFRAKASKNPSHYYEMMETADILLLGQTTENWAPFDTASMKERYGSKVLTYTPVHFNGVHPDITYVGNYGQRVLSATGDYHSRIALSSFLSGLEVGPAAENFASLDFSRFGFERIYRDSETEYRRRDESVDVKMADWFLDEIKRRPLLYTFNHPNSDFIQKIAAKVCQLSDIIFELTSLVQLPTQLSSSVIWPIHKSWSNLIGLAYHTPDIFWSGNYAMDLNEFVWRSYQQYEKIDRDSLIKAVKDRKVPRLDDPAQFW